MIQQIITLTCQRYPNMQLNSRNITVGSAMTRNSGILHREILHASLHNADYKLVEKITFKGQPLGRFAVAIGYNPALLDFNHIDKTNELIADYLYSLGYAGYYLLNLLPDVSHQKPNKSASNFNDFYQIIEIALANLPQISSMDLFIFWGSSVYVNSKEKIAFDGMLSRFASSYTIGTSKAKHKHPGRGVNSSTILRHVVNAPLALTNSINGYLR